MGVVGAVTCPARGHPGTGGRGCQGTATARARTAAAPICASLGPRSPSDDSCQVLAEPHDAENDDTLWFGAMLALSGARAEGYGLPTLHAVDIARQDFARISGGLPSVDDRPGTRPIGIVACNDAAGASGPFGTWSTSFIQRNIGLVTRRTTCSLREVHPDPKNSLPSLP